MLKLLRVELEKLVYSRFFYATLAMMLAYALIMALGFRSVARRFDAGAVDSGAFFLYMSFMISFYPIFTSIAVIHGGGAISPELRAGTMRYTLLAPVPRASVLLVKYVVLLVTLAAAIAFLFFALAGIGYLLFGQGNVVSYDVWSLGKPDTRVTTLFTDEESLRRCLLALPFALYAALAVATPAFLLSTVIENPLLAIVVPLSGFLISSLIQFTNFVDPLKPYLPTRHMFYWDAVFTREIPWDQVMHGVSFHTGMIAVCLGAALALFVVRDVKT